MKTITLLLLILWQCTSYAGFLDIYITAPAKKIQWKNNTSLIKSFTQSSLEATRHNSMQDLARAAVGHAATHLNCRGQSQWSSISIATTRIMPKLVKGPRALFIPTEGAYIQSEKEIKRLITNNAHKTKKLRLKITSDNDCLKLQDFIHIHQKAQLWFAASIDTYRQYQQDEKLGGTGTSWVLAMIKIIKPNLNEQVWLQKFKDFEFVDPQKMYDNLHSPFDM